MGFLDYVGNEYLVILGYEKVEAEEFHFIIYLIYSLIPIIFFALFFKSRYGKIKVLYDTPKPTTEELRNDIIKYSHELIVNKDKITIESLCRYYINKHGKDDDVENILKNLKNNS